MIVARYATSILPYKKNVSVILGIAFENQMRKPATVSLFARFITFIQYQCNYDETMLNLSIASRCSDI